jgi:glycosyltransferase involved in cell wall biosynthesis
VNITKYSPSIKEGKKSADLLKNTFLCTTRLIWEKGIKEMVEAFELLPDSLKSNLQLLIIGEPDDKIQGLSLRISSENTIKAS